MPTTHLDDVAQATRRIRDIHADAENVLLRRLSDAVGKGADSTWIGQELAARQTLLRDVDRLLVDLDKRVPAAVREAHRYAYGKGAERADGAVSAYRSGERAMLAAAPEAVLARAALDTESMRYQVRRWTADVYDKATQRAAGLVVTGAATRRDASARLLASLTDQGVTGFVDRAGRNWEMGAYAEMAVRTSTMNATLQGHSDRLQSYGIDTVVISDHAEECDRCREWEGQVVSLTGATSGTLSDGRRVKGTLSDAQTAGVFHPGCRHTTSAYLPGVTKVNKQTADPEGDELRRTQRAKERRIRELKRRVQAQEGVAGKNSAGAVRERAKLRAAQRDFSGWRKQHGRKNLGYRTRLPATTRPASEAVAAYAWDPEWYPLSNSLRTGRASKQNLERARMLDRAFDEAPAGGTVKVHRMVSGSADLESELRNVARQGGIWKDNGFMSTTTSLDVAQDFAMGMNDVRLDITVPAGVQRIRVPASVAQAGMDQKEVLLPRGMRLQLLGVSTEDEITVIRATVLQQGAAPKKPRASAPAPKAAAAPTVKAKPTERTTTTVRRTSKQQAQVDAAAARKRQRASAQRSRLRRG